MGVQVKKIAVVIAIGVAALGIAGCESNAEWEERHKPYTMPAEPGEPKILCEYDRDGSKSEWDCEQING